MNLDAFLRCEWGVFISNMDSCGLQLLSRQVSGPLKLSCQHFFSHLICQGSPNTFIYLFFFLENLYTRAEYYYMSTAGAEQVLFHCSPIQVKFRSLLNTSWKMKQSSAMPQTCTGGGRGKKRHSASSDQHSSPERKYNIVLRDAGIHLWTSLSAEPSLWATSQERKEKPGAPGRNETPSAAHSSKKH